MPSPADPRQPDLLAVPFIPPCKPKLADRVPVGDLWHYELKFNGSRAQCHVLDGRVRIYSKSGKDLTSCLPGIAGQLAQVNARWAVIDGEAVMLDNRGHPDFFALHAAIAKFRAPAALLFTFDLLHLDGVDLRPKPLAERRAMLAELLVDAGPALHLSKHYAAPIVRTAHDGEHELAMARWGMPSSRRVLTTPQRVGRTSCASGASRSTSTSCCRWSRMVGRPMSATQPARIGGTGSARRAAV